jgi:hypothetical protein
MGHTHTAVRGTTNILLSVGLARVSVSASLSERLCRSILYHYPVDNQEWQENASRQTIALVIYRRPLYGVCLVDELVARDCC